MPGGAELSEKLPDEMFQLVESFKKFVREQKSYRDQKFDVESILEVERDTEEFTLAFQRVAVDSDKNAKLIQQIKDETTALLRHSELAYSLLRSHFANSPSFQQQQQQQQQQQPQNSNSLNSRLGGLTNPINNDQQSSMMSNQANLLHQQQPFYLSASLNQRQQSPYNSNHNQFANTSTSQYFSDLADEFEARMRAYGDQIKELKMSLDSIIKNYDVDELFRSLKKQHETLGEIAAKVYMTHERIMDKSELEKQQQQQQQQQHHFNNTNNHSFAAT